MKLDYKFALLTFCSILVVVVVFQSVDALTESYMQEEQITALATQSANYKLPAL